MSRVSDEKQYKNRGTIAQAEPRRGKSRYIVYRPTKEEREAIKADKAPLASVMQRLTMWVQKDAKLTIGHKAENDAYFAHLTDLGVDWQNAITLSVWHSDWETALRTLDYGLRTRYEQFPDIQLELFPDDLNW
jgi:hypothetical protein